MSKNAPTLDQIKMVCRHFIELRKTGMTENLAIRLLELLTDSYAKFLVLGHVSPHHADQFVLWSKAARRAQKANPKRKYREYLCNEHGTPRRDFARKVLAKYKEGKLTKGWMDRFCKRKWKIAVVTLDEDSRLNKLKGKSFSTPEKRWAAAGIPLERRNRIIVRKIKREG